MSLALASPHPPRPLPGRASLGAGLVLASAIVWSSGGIFGRLLGDLDPWTVIFWRAGFAALFLLGFMTWRDGPRGALARFRTMGRPGLAVALCFAVASTAFVVALGYTTVANILLVQAGGPLLAALGGRVFLGEPVSRTTWVAIAAVLGGVAVMVSGTLTGRVSPVGDLLALLIVFAAAAATLVTRRHAGVPMTPAVCLGTLVAALVAAVLAPTLAAAPGDYPLLAGFGALNLGLGLALFVSGVPLIPAAVAALLGTAEIVLGPFWVWLLLGETPPARTLAGGGIVLAALGLHLAGQIHSQIRERARRRLSTGAQAGASVGGVGHGGNAVAAADMTGRAD